MKVFTLSSGQKTALAPLVANVTAAQATLQAALIAYNSYLSSAAPGSDFLNKLTISDDGNFLTVQ